MGDVIQIETSPDFRFSEVGISDNVKVKKLQINLRITVALSLKRISVKWKTNSGFVPDLEPLKKTLCLIIVQLIFHNYLKLSPREKLS